MEPKQDTPVLSPGGRAPPPPPPRKRMTTYSAAALEGEQFADVSFIVPGIIPRGVTLLVGKPKCGKSWLSLDVAWAVASGDTVLNGVRCEQGDVLYCALEDNKRRMKQRMEIQRPSQPIPSRLHITHELCPLEQGGDEDVRSWLMANPQAKLVIVDVLSKVRPTQRKTEDKYQHDYRTLSSLNKLANDFGVGVIVVHHVRKMEAEDEFDTVSGTLGLTGAADTIVILKRGKQGHALIGRGRDIEDFDITVQQGADCRWTVVRDAFASLSVPRRAIIGALQSGATSPAQIALAARLGSDAVRAMLGQMVLAGEVEKEGRGVYRLPQQRGLVA
jgi:hypothetical protein